MDFRKDYRSTGPDFGYSHSDVNEIVLPFYSYWMNFRTTRSFRKCGYYDVNMAKIGFDRKLSRKKYTKDIKSLLKFMKRWDPRVPKTKHRVSNISPEDEKFEYWETSSEDLPCLNWEIHYEYYHDDIDEVDNQFENEFGDDMESLTCKICQICFGSRKNF
ncbi:hypothetical protein RF11_15210 [Thelohanellus kitauei]|uniref:Uncharacterized protein n=1 Tax=Thelohanellus kitauei TaxID=669202 RepID=A0A0C2MZF2_THEKT|nr:hypothetical protein RF11_15210 [Thelohanellus kitauei]